MAKQLLKARSQQRPEDNILTSCTRDFEAGRYASVRDTLKATAHQLETDPVKLQLLRLWEESLYREFIQTKMEARGGNAEVVLSSSMRYKLRKKYPCPVELDQELRVKNARLPKHVHDGLNAWLKLHKQSPYPNKKDKEELAGQLAITPQQVNRWFIQRRKMIKMRGSDYVGRFDTVNEGDDDHMSSNDDESEDDSRMSTSVSPAGPNAMNYHYHPSSMLQNILTATDRRSYSPSGATLMVSQGMSSGGSVEVLNGGAARFLDNGTVLTPPPSLSGDSVVFSRSARSTPPHPSDAMTSLEVLQHVAASEPLDLSGPAGGAKAVILAPASPPSNYASRASSLSSSPVPNKDNNMESQYEELNFEEQMAVSGLLCLGGLNR